MFAARAMCFQFSRSVVAKRQFKQIIVLCLMRDSKSIMCHFRVRNVRNTLSDDSAVIRICNQFDDFEFSQDSGFIFWESPE